MRVGLIGLGRMGGGMAKSLLAAGFELRVYNRTPAKAEPFRDLGATVSGSVGELCREAEAVITSLADDTAVEETVFGDDGLLANLPREAIHVGASTIGVALADTLAARHASAGQVFVAAPVFGRPDAAAAGELVVVAAGAATAIERLTPVFEAIGRRTEVVGGTPSQATLVKLAGNFLIGSVIESLGEALALVSKGGVERQQFLDLLTSTLFDAPVYRTYGQLIVDGKFEPAGFAAPLGCKDIRLALAAGDGLQVPMPLASLLRDRLLTLIATGGGAKDWSALGGLAATQSGQR